MNNTLNISNRTIGEANPCYIIAEMSANHGGEIGSAIEIIHAAKDCGADCVKIQTYTADTLTMNCTNEYFQINEGTWKGENLYSLYQKAYTPWEWQGRLKDETEKLGMDFLSTPFDKTAVDFLEDLGVNFYKIASFELVDIPLIQYVASKGKPIIMSTGMASLGEIEEAVKAVKSAGNENLCLLKCSSSYPAVPEDMNLLTLSNMRQTFGTIVGLSDHSLSTVPAVTAVALGAKVVEKHFCISRGIITADSSFSMEPDEFKSMVRDIKEAEKAMGIISYSISQKEKESRIFRKSIFVERDIKKGEIFTENNIRIMRPAYGLEPKHYDNVIGKTALIDINSGTPLNWNMIG